MLPCFLEHVMLCCTLLNAASLACSCLHRRAFSTALCQNPQIFCVLALCLVPRKCKINSCSFLRLRKTALRKSLHHALLSLILRRLRSFYCVGGAVKPSVAHMAAISHRTGGLLNVRIMPEASWLLPATTTKRMFEDMIVGHGSDATNKPFCHSWYLVFPSYKGIRVYTNKQK